jgi:TolB-like protein
MKLLMYTLVSTSLFFSGCVTAPERANPETSVRKEIRDLPAQRGGDEDLKPRKRVMVLPFLDAQPERSTDWADRTRANFIAELNRSGEVFVLDSKDLKLDLGKHIKGNEYDLAEVARLSQNMGVSAILEGQFVDMTVQRSAPSVGIFRQMKTVFEVKVRIRMVSTRGGKEIFNTLKTVTLEEANLRVGENIQSDRFMQANPRIFEDLVEEAFLDFQPQILAAMQKLTWEGRIAAVSGDRIFLNVGRMSGLNVGDILKVSEDGNDIFDPKTGNFIGRVPGRLKGTLEVISYFGQDGSIAIIHSGAGFKENDKVELY